MYFSGFFCFTWTVFETTLVKYGLEIVKIFCRHFMFMEKADIRYCNNHAAFVVLSLFG